MKKLFFLFSLLLVAYTFGTAQTVSHVRFAQKGQMIEIHYDIRGAAFYEHFNAELWVSTDGGVTFTGPLKHVTGDVGLNIEEGQDKTITWDVYKEMPDFGGAIVFDVRATLIQEEVARQFYIGYKGSYFAPLGVVIGMTGRTGFYLSARINPGFLESPDYNTDGESFEDYGDARYFSFTGIDKTQRLSATAGLQFQVSKSTHLYVGGGYTTYGLLWEMEMYDYPAELTGTSWANHTGESYSGVELEAGLMISMGHFFLSAGAALQNFKFLDGTIGIGVIF